MKENHARIVGVRKFQSSDGKRTYFNYFTAGPYTAYDQEHSEYAHGVCTDKVFSSQDFGLMPGDVVEFKYRPGYEGRATLIGVEVITPGSDADVDIIRSMVDGAPAAPAPTGKK